MLKRKLTLTGICATLALGVAACSSGGTDTVADVTAEPEYSGTLSILTKFAGDPLDAYFKDLAKEYEKQHEGVKIKLIQETDQSVKDKTQTLTASGALPDIYFTWPGQWGEKFATGGLAADLTDVIGPDTEWGKQFGEASLDAFKFDDKYFGIPLYNNGKFMGYNKAAFKDAGVKEPSTFEELIDSCEPLKQAGYEPISFGNKDGWPGLHYLQQLFAYNVPESVLEKDFDPETAKWSDPGYKKSLAQFQELVSKCTSSGNGSNGVLYTTAQEAFSSGKAAMYYQEILEFDGVANEDTKLSPDDFGLFQLPAPGGAKGDPQALEGSPEGYFINAKSPRAALAVDFMKFATSEKNAETLSASPYGQPSAVVGAVNEKTSSPAVMTGIDRVNDASQLVVWLDMITVPDVADAWLSGGEALVSNDSSPEKVLQSVQRANQDASE
jgi:raffinose/stachyose/melibiose transport system substrate-binding protein